MFTPIIDLQGGWGDHTWGYGPWGSDYLSLEDTQVPGWVPFVFSGGAFTSVIDIQNPNWATVIDTQTSGFTPINDTQN